MDYQKQAENFLKKTETTLQVKFLKHDLYFPGETEKRDIYKIKLTRGTREYCFNYGDSIQNSDDRILSYLEEKGLTKYLKDKFNNQPKRLRNELQESRIQGVCLNKTKQNKTKSEEDLKNWESIHLENTRLKPSNYDILACLNGFCDYDNVDDFAAEFGYEKPSIAIKVFKAVQKESEELQKLFNDKELELLTDIC